MSLASSASERLMEPMSRAPHAIDRPIAITAWSIGQEAILVLEAAVTADPDSSLGWQTLGQAHADADDDVCAITCLRRAVAVDPHNLDALLALGVSYTNELDQTRALEHLQLWLDSHPDFAALADHADHAAGSLGEGGGEMGVLHPFELQQRVTARFQRAVTAFPDNPDLHAVLGVLHNLSRSYDEAIGAFQAALRLRPTDYSLWNKLGATQANSMSCAQAVPCYISALEHKPQVRVPRPDPAHSGGLLSPLPPLACRAPSPAAPPRPPPRLARCPFSPAAPSRPPRPLARRSFP